MLLIIDNKKLDNKTCKTNADGLPSGLENAKNFLLEIGTKKIITDEARYLYDSFIKPDVDKLEKSKSRGKDKKNNILTILNNVEASVLMVFIFITLIHHQNQNQKKVLKREYN